MSLILLNDIGGEHRRMKKRDAHACCANAQAVAQRELDPLQISLMSYLKFYSKSVKLVLE